MDFDFDLIVIGAGPAGYVAAERAGLAGLKVCLVEREPHLGGVCLNWGCIPTKTLLACAKAYYTAAHGESFGVVAENVSFDFAKARKRRDDVQNRLRKGIQALMKMGKVTVEHGLAKVVAERTVEVTPAEGEPKRITATNVLVAAGSEPAVPPIAGSDQAHVLTSNGILEIQELPKQLVIIGGGVIGCEFACFFAMVGVDVTVVEMAPEICPGIDADCAKQLRDDLKKKGVTFHLGARVTGITQQDVAFTDSKGVEVTAAADTVLMSVGRVPNAAATGLDALDVLLDGRAVVVDDQCRTNLPWLYAAGDVTGKSLLAHTASRQAEVVVNTLTGRADRMRYGAIPGVVYTSPEIAVVGLTEAKAKEQGREVLTAAWPLQNNGRFLAEYDGRGVCKVVVDAATRQLLGVHIVGGAASEMIAAFATMIETELRVEDITDLVFPHPTVSEAARDALWTLRH